MVSMNGPKFEVKMPCTRSMAWSVINIQMQPRLLTTTLIRTPNFTIKWIENKNISISLKMQALDWLNMCFRKFNQEFSF